MSEKMWGDEPFWGLGYEWDPDWILTDRQRGLRETLISLCETEMRANAKRSDDELLFPRRNLELLGEHGFLALCVPQAWGGLGEDHVAYAMAAETIARYGCASTAMCWVMHMGAVAALMLRPTPELVEKYLSKLNSGLIGTLSYSDPETGSHFWYPVSSSAERRDGGYKINKKASWTTSGGFADFYVLQTTSPDFKGYDDLSVFMREQELMDRLASTSILPTVASISCTVSAIVGAGALAASVPSVMTQPGYSGSVTGDAAGIGSWEKPKMYSSLPSAIFTMPSPAAR